MIPHPDYPEIQMVPVVTVEETGEVFYALQPKQYEAYCLTPLARGEDEPYPENIGYGGAAGGGKSYLSRAIAVATAFLWPGSVSIIFRRTEREVMENHVNNLRLELPERFLGPDGTRETGNQLWGWNGEEMCATFWNGSRIYFGYLKSDKDVARYQGQGYDCMIFEEATHYGWRAVSWLLGNRLRATTAGSRPFAFFPSNPGGPGHMWFKRLFVEQIYYEEDDERADDYAFVQAKLADNQVLMRRDPRYVRRLNKLPSPHREWLRDGDFKQGAGSALPELDRTKHLIEPFEVPFHWVWWGAFDWGFKHPWSFGFYCADEDGNIYKVATISGMHMQPKQIVDRIQRQGPVPIERLQRIVAGHDLWAKRRAYGEQGTTLQQRFMALGMPCIQADIDRVQGLESLRTVLAWREQGPEGEDGEPGFFLFDEPGNRKCYRTLENMTPDEDNPEDVLKVDADERGEGGDDAYDETRYAIHTYPLFAESTFASDTRPIGWAPETLAYEADEQMTRHTRDTVPVPGEIPDELSYGEFGVNI